MIARYAGSAVVAICVTFGLFFLMNLLIATGEEAMTNVVSGPSIEITREEREETIEREERELPDKPEVEQPPDQPEMAKTQSLRPGATSINVAMNLNNSFQGAGVDLGGAPSDGDILPLVRVPPQYPRVALQRGIEGYVILEFDISPEGTPVNIRVIEAEPNGIFDRAATNAVERFKYKPMIVNGKPTIRYGVQFKMTFELENR